MDRSQPRATAGRRHYLNAEEPYAYTQRQTLQQTHAKPHATAAARQTRPRPAKSPTAKNGALSRFFSFFCFYETPKNDVSILPNAG